MSYPKIIKEAALEKMFHTDLSLRHIADELGIPRATLHGWKRKYQMIKNDSETVRHAGRELDARRKVCGGIRICNFK